MLTNITCLKNNKHCFSSNKNNSKRILLVEDNKIIQRLHILYLQQLGYTVDLAQTAEEALLLFSRGYNLVLLDIGLPDKSGIEVAKELRCFENKTGAARAFIVVLTAHSEEVMPVCRAAGCDDFYVKPLIFETLQNVLQRWLES